ncbi:sensor histidine kinase [Nocardioides sp.]|uniref:sensor histidine kinase n=1 Tax=Nocardioides sp. TaxID=35761 RepID=UPI0031FE516D|nr:putative two-component system histidine kinase [Nocardioides sp.]
MSRRRVAATLAGFGVLEVVAAIVFAVLGQMSFQDTLDTFVLTNGLMGLSFAVCGGLIAWHRPGNAVGWLFVADGLAHASSALLAPMAIWVHEEGGPMAVQRVAGTAVMLTWPWAIALFLPLSLLLFPDGRIGSARWRVVAWAVALTSPLFVLEMVLDPKPLSEGLPSSYFAISGYDSLSALWGVVELRTSLAIAVAVVGLVVRYRQGDELRRRQLLWLLLAAVAVLGVIVPWSFVSGTPIVVLFAIPLIPVAVTVAIVRDQLFDIRLVVSRALAWLILSLAALVGYVVLVAALDSLVSARVGRSALVTVLVALGLAPVLPRLQRLVDRWMYGDRGDPARVASRVGEHLVSGDQGGLDDVVAAIRSALRLPYVGVVTRRGPVAAAGVPANELAVVPLTYAREEVGSIHVGLRSGERQLSTADRSTLELVAASLAIAVHTAGLSADLQLSRERIVLAREEERRRIRQDLHDGLGPTLTGVALHADAAANLVMSDPDTTRDLLRQLRRDTRGAIADVRRLVDGLRPPVLDELGLLEALRQRAGQLSLRSDGSTLDVRLLIPQQLPSLPAAVEVAAYRIATEALTNVARHARASLAVLELSCDDDLEIDVLDDGAAGDPWTQGVGLAGMRERAAEVGGSFEAGPTARGGRVHVSFPLGAT